MTKPNRGGVIAVLIVLNVCTLGFLWFQYLNRPVPPIRPGDGIDADAYFAERVGLDDDQALTVRRLREEHFTRTDSIRQSIFQLNRQLMDELFTAESGRARVDSLTAAIGQQHALFEQRVFEHFDSILAICRPEQRPRLHDLVRETLERNRRIHPGPADGPPRRPPPPGGRP